MASLLLNKDTLTAQVVARLEREIRSGALAPLSRLKSTREMAAAFGVSQKVVLYALDELEAKKLLRRKERAGVFVSELASDPGVAEALIFVFGDNPERNPFVRLVCDVVSSEAAQGRFDFFTRFVTLSVERLHDRDYMRRRLDAELARLGKQFHPDVALVMGPRFDRGDVEKCLTLPFPLLFVGDFARGDFPGLDYNRLGTTHDFYDLPVRWAAARGAKRVTLMASSILADCLYFSEALEYMRRTAAAVGVETTVIQVADAHSTIPGRMEAGLAAAADTFAEQGGTDVLTLSCLPHAPLMEALRRKGFEPFTDKLPVLSCERGEHMPGMKYQQLLPSNSAALHRRVRELMEELAAGKLKNFREQYAMEREIAE